MENKNSNKPKANESSEIKEKYLENFLELYSRINVPIYSNDVIKSNLFKNYFETISNYKDFSGVLKNIRNTLHHNFSKTDQRQIVREIKQFYKSEKLVLVLGAGVSMNYGLPSWDILLQKLIVTIFLKSKRIRQGFYLNYFQKSLNQAH